MVGEYDDDVDYGGGDAGSSKVMVSNAPVTDTSW